MESTDPFGIIFSDPLKKAQLWEVIVTSIDQNSDVESFHNGQNIIFKKQKSF